MTEQEPSYMRALNKLAKWRSVFAAWQLGTRGEDDPEVKALKDHREATLMLRAEISALTCLLIKKGVFTTDEFAAALGEEAEMLSADFETRFPGMSATDQGISYDLQKIREHGTMEGWPP